MNAWVNGNSQSLLPRHWPPNSGDTESLLTAAAEIIRNLHTSMWSTCMDTESLCLYTHRCEYGTCVSRCPVWPMPSTWLLNIHTYACGHYRHTTIGARLEWSESYTSRVWSCLCLKFCYFVHHGFFFALILIFLKYCIKIFILGASQVSQWLRICLAMQGTLVRSLVQDPTCHGATKPVHHNYWACAPDPRRRNHWSLRT